jgi:hypothetical protein
MTAMIADLSKYPVEDVNIIPVWSTKEVVSLTSQLDSVLTATFVAAGRTPRPNQVPYVSTLPPLDRTGFSAGVVVEYNSNNPPAGRFADEMARLLNLYGIAARPDGKHSDWKGDKDHPDPAAVNAAFITVWVGEVP